MSDECTCSKCNTKANRIAAFGAIRRAAEVARECEATGWEQTTIGLQWGVVEQG